MLKIKSHGCRNLLKTLSTGVCAIDAILISSIVIGGVMIGVMNTLGG